MADINISFLNGPLYTRLGRPNSVTRAWEGDDDRIVCVFTFYSGNIFDQLIAASFYGQYVMLMKIIYITVWCCVFFLNASCWLGRGLDYL